MRHVHTTLLTLTALLLAPVGCTKQTGEEQATTTAPITTPPPADGEPADGEPASERPTLSRAECEGKGGRVVGDIGDGAIHRPDYTCESGQPPIATIQPAGDEPIATEGEVCCQ